MNYCIAAADRFEAIADPYNNGRICYKSRNNFFERLDMTRILEDLNFLFIHNDVVYFKA